MLRRAAQLFAFVALLLIAFGGGAAACSSSGGGAPSDVERRMAVLDDVAARMEALLNERVDATPADLHALLLGRPELVETGVEEDGAWGIFADGRLLYLLDDREAAPRATSSSAALRPRSATTPDVPPYELPTNDRVLFIDTMGSLYTPYWQDIKPWFDHAAYITSYRRGLVEEFKDLGGFGVVYINSHGGRRKDKKTGESFFVVTTASPVSEAGDAANEADLRDGSLVYVATRQDLLPNGKFTVGKVYAFTPTFVFKHVELLPGSLVVMDTCSSADPELAGAFLVQGASLYGGWTDKVRDPNAAVTVKYFSDRMLAANEFMPESPPQRSFNYAEVVANMNVRGVAEWPIPGGKTTHFEVIPAGTQSVGLLVPSLKHVVVGAGLETNDVLLLNGSFGSMEGKVLVNGNPISCSDWFSDALICPVAVGGASGGARIVVDANGALSNPRMLSEWKGTFTYTGKIGCGPGSARGITATMRATVRFRADAGPFREHAGEPPVLEPVTFGVDRDKTVFASASGECSYTWPGLGSETTRWSGTREVPWEDEHSVGVVDVANRRIRLHLELHSGNAFQEATTCDGTLCAQGAVDVRFKTGDEGFADGTDEFAEAVFDIPLDEGLNGVAGSRQGPEPADYGIPRSSLSWTTLRVSGPPDPDAPR